MVTIVALFGVNIGTPFILVFMSDGSAYAFNVTTGSSTLIANAGTFSATGPGDVTIWQGSTVLIVDPAFGYFRWPGTAGGATSPAVEVISPPTLTLGATGAAVDAGTHQWAVTFVINTVETKLGQSSATLNLPVAGNVNLTNLPLGPTGTTARKIYRTKANTGSSYFLVATISDNVTVSFLDTVADASLGAAAPAQGAVDAGTHIYAVTFLAGATESALGDPSVPISPLVPSTVLVYDLPIGPGGTTARNIYRTPISNPTVFQFAALINNNTDTEYSDTLADASLGAAFNGPTSDLVSSIDATKKGTTIAVFAGRVWIGNDRTVQFSAPNSYTDFSLSSAGGLFVMTDSNFIGPITKLLTALDVLWTFGESAINQLSNVSILPNSTTTTFSNINVSSSVGTIFPRSVISFLRQIEFATKYGVIQQVGVTPQRISEKIDGTYKFLDLQQPVTAGLVVLNDILCYGLMVTYLDPDNPDPNNTDQGLPRKIILIVSFDGKWFIGSQGDSLVRIASVEDSGGYRLFGADLNNIYELFVQPHYPVHKLKTPLFDQGDLTAGKHMIRAGVLINYDATQETHVTVTPQTALGPKNADDPTKSNELELTPAQGSFLQFFGAGDIKIITKGYNFPQWNIGMNSKLVGFNLSIDSDPFEILAYAIDVESLESWGDFV